MMRRSLSFKLLLSYLLVVAIAAVAAFGVARWLGPRLFDHEVQQIGQRAGWTDGSPGNGGQGSVSGTDAGQGPGNRGQGPGGTGTGGTTTPGSTVGPGAGLDAQQSAIEEELGDAFTGSLTVAILVALGVGGVAGLLAAVFVSRRVLRPLDRMRSAVRRMAGGDHTERVPVPPDRELADLAVDVNALGEALAATEHRRTRLVSDLSHELRTPITALDGFLEGLEDGVFEPDGETLAAMRTETRRLERLASDLGALSLTAEQAFHLERDRSDLAGIAAMSARALAGAAAAADVEIDVTGLATDLPVEVDADRMGQVFTNLVRNAIQHTGRGGRVTVSGGRSGGSAFVRVADTGSGIPEDQLERVFERFVRLDDGDGAGGSGVGLTIARGIVDAHGGTLVASNDGGAVFTVTLPLT
jgi:signal transduction histidine kinase